MYNDGNAMIADQGNDNSQFWRNVKSIFIKWEKLRLLYNAILAATLVILIGSSRENSVLYFFSPYIVLQWMLCGIGANICYFAAPITESYIRWLGINGRWITVLLFAAGVLVSIPLVFVFGLGTAGLLLPVHQ